MKILLSVILLFSYPLKSAHDMPEIPEFAEEQPEVTWEMIEGEFKNDAAKKAAARAWKMFIDKAIDAKDLNAAFGWYESLPDDGRKLALKTVLTKRDPVTLKKNELKKLEDALLQFGPKIFGEDEKAVHLWKPFLPRIFPAQAIEIEEPLKTEKAEKGEKGAEPQFRHGIYPSVEKAPAKPVIERVPKPSSKVVMLYSKDAPNQKFPVERSLLADEDIAGRISGLLEDQDVHDIELTYPVDVVRDLADGFKAVRGGIKYWLPLKEKWNKALWQKSVVDAMDQFRSIVIPYAFQKKNLVELLKAAHYENSPYLTDLLARDYARYLHEIKKGAGAKNPRLLIDILKRHNFPDDLLRLIATQYFLLFNEGIDREVLGLIAELRKAAEQQTKSSEKDTKSKDISASPATIAREKGIIPIPFDVLVAWRKITPEEIKYFPNLAKDPNEIRELRPLTPITALMETAKGKRLSLAEYERIFRALLRLKGIDVNVKLPRLGYVIEHVVPVSAGALEDLLQAGADIEVRNNFGNTPLMIAVASSKPEQTKMLIDAGANVNAATETGFTVWNAAEHLPKNDPSAIRIREMLTKAGVRKVRYVEPGKMTDLQNAAEENDANTIASLLASGAKIDEKTEKGSTALMLAVRNNAIDAIRELIQRHADLNANDSNGESPITLAIGQGNPDILELLIKAGAKVTEEHVGRARQAVFYGVNKKVLELLEAALKK